MTPAREWAEEKARALVGMLTSEMFYRRGEHVMSEVEAKQHGERVTQALLVAQAEAHQEGFQAGLAASWLDHPAAHRELGFPAGFHSACNSCKDIAALQEKARAEERELACVAMCPYCQAQWQLLRRETFWMHQDPKAASVQRMCFAAAIRAREKA